MQTSSSIGLKHRCDVSVLVISYNTCALTLACLESVYMETRTSKFEVVVVDNASTDGSADMVAMRFPQAKLVVSKDNLGFAAGNNVAARQALGRYILLLNPDTVVLNGAIDTLVEFAAQYPNARIYGGRTVNEDGTLDPASCHRRPTLWGLFCQAIGFSSIFRSSAILNVEAYGGWQRDTVRTVNIVSGCFLLIERELWTCLQGFDERYFMYCEEDDLCMRAWEEGARPIVCPNASIIHYGGRSETSHSDKIVKRLISQNLLLSRHWHPRGALLGGYLRLVYVLRRLITWKLVEVMGIRCDRHQSTTFWNVWLRRDEWTYSKANKGVKDANDGQ